MAYITRDKDCPYQMGNVLHMNIWVKTFTFLTFQNPQYDTSEKFCKCFVISQKVSAYMKFNFS